MAATTAEVGTYNVVARYAGTLLVGTYLARPGVPAGLRTARVTASCVTISSLVCQDISRVWSQAGDSGSPVFVWIGGSNVQLHGVVGRSDERFHFTTTYSRRLAGIEADPGALTNLCIPSAGC